MKFEAVLSLQWEEQKAVCEAAAIFFEPVWMPVAQKWVFTRQPVVALYRISRKRDIFVNFQFLIHGPNDDLAQEASVLLAVGRTCASMTRHLVVILLNKNSHHFLRVWPDFRL